VTLVRIAKWSVLALIVLVTAIVTVATIRRYDYPDLSAYEALRLSTGKAPAGEVTVTYAGVATLLFSDGTTSIMIDGFFSRAGLLEILLTRIEPDPQAIADGLEAMGADSIAAVLCVHSHYDHCMDSPVVALQTGADLIGSESTAWIGRGMNLPEPRIRVADYGTVYKYGDFTITMYESRHVPLSWNASVIGRGLSAPLTPPARATKWLEGGSYSILIEHPGTSALVQGSAGYIDGALDDVDVDVLFLGLGALGTKDDAYVDGYWDALIDATSPERVVPIHFEDFFGPVSSDQKPLSALTDDLERTFSKLVTHTDALPDTEVALMPYLQPVALR
jgi:L-ascorbate metabolism protein UlaG (beta-lactamase superfamily)